MSLPPPCVLPLRVTKQDSTRPRIDNLQFVPVIHDRKVEGRGNRTSRRWKGQGNIPSAVRSDRVRPSQAGSVRKDRPVQANRGGLRDTAIAIKRDDRCQTVRLGFKWPIFPNHA